MWCFRCGVLVVVFKVDDNVYVVARVVWWDAWHIAICKLVVKMHAHLVIGLTTRSSRQPSCKLHEIRM